MTINQLIKWRDRLLDGKGDRYYPAKLKVKLIDYVKKYTPTEDKIRHNKAKKIGRALERGILSTEEANEAIDKLR